MVKQLIGLERVVITWLVLKFKLDVKNLSHVLVYPFILNPKLRKAVNSPFQMWLLCLNQADKFVVFAQNFRCGWSLFIIRIQVLSRR
jgi:hypothetical protein